MKDERRTKKNKPEGYIDLFAEDDEEEAPAVGSLFSDDDEDEKDLAEADEAAEELEDEDEEPEDEAEDEPADEAEGPGPDQPAWSMPLPTDEEAAEAPDDGAPRAPRSDQETFTFDRYGRRTGKVPRKKRPKERYGKRKHAKKATTRPRSGGSRRRPKSGPASGTSSGRSSAVWRRSSAGPAARWR